MRLALKLLKGLIITLTTICLIYSIAWFALLNLISIELNKKYAGKEINNNYGNFKEQYILTFSKIEPVGFPFKIAFKVLNWTEDNKTSRTNFNMPIYAGYDLLKQHIFVTFSGEIISKYKPLESGFGLKFQLTNQEFLIKFPITLSLIKVLFSKDKSFEIINFATLLESKSDNVKIFDMIDNEKYYEENNALLKISINKNHYYTTLEDLLDNLPQKFDVIYAAEVITGMPINRIVPQILLLPKIIWNFVFKADADFYIKSNNKTLSDFSKDLEIGVHDLKFSSNIHTSSNNLLYKKKISDHGESIFVKLASNIELHNNIYPTISHILKYLISGEARFFLGVNYKLNEDLKNELQYIVDNPEKFTFKEFENRKYSCNLELSNLNSRGIIHTKLNSFRLFSGNTGINLKSEIDLIGIINLNIKGLILLNNYQSLIGLASNYLYRMGKYKNFSDESRKLYKETLQSFLRTISDHPESTSNDLSVEYKIDFSNINGSKIGIAKMHTLKSLYHIALYKKALEKIKVKDASDDIASLVLELAPTITDNPELFKQLITNPTKIDKTTWEEIIK
jgi:hypothetical protein